MLNYTPSEPQYANEWFVRTNWWKHKLGWRVKGARLSSALHRAYKGLNRFMDTPVGKWLFNVASGLAVGLLLAYLLIRSGLKTP